MHVCVCLFVCLKCTQEWVCARAWTCCADLLRNTAAPLPGLWEQVGCERVYASTCHTSVSWPRLEEPVCGRHACLPCALCLLALRYPCPVTLPWHTRLRCCLAGSLEQYALAHVFLFVIMADFVPSAAACHVELQGWLHSRVCLCAQPRHCRYANALP